MSLHAHSPDWWCSTATRASVPTTSPQVSKAQAALEAQTQEMKTHQERVLRDLGAQEALASALEARKAECVAAHAVRHHFA